MNNSIETSATTQPKVFIGMMVYNGEKFLPEAIESLLAQTYTDFKLFVSDDASTDKTAEICKHYATRDKRIEYYRHTKNIGMICNFNFVINKATSPYFMWAAQDDLWGNGFLTVCVKNLENNPKISIAASGVADIDSYGRTLRELSDFPKLSGTPGIISVTRYVMQPEILGKCNILYSLFRLSAVKEILRIYPLKLEWGYDYNFGLAAISHFGILIEKQVLFKKRLGGFSNPESNKKDREDKVQVIIIKNPKNHMFPFGRFNNYLSGHRQALSGTPYTLLASVLLFLRLPRAFINHLMKRNYRKFIRKIFGSSIQNRKT